MTLKTRRRTFVDRHLFSSSPPSYHPSRLPDVLKPHVAIRQRLEELADVAFPCVNAFPHDVPTFSVWQRRVNSMEGPLNMLVTHLEGLDTTGPQHAQLCAEAQIPAVLVELLSRLMRYRSIATCATKSQVENKPCKHDPTTVMHHPAALRVVDTALVFVLRTMNVLSASSELLSARLAIDRRLLPLLFETMRCQEAVEMSLALIEEVLHAPKRPPDLDLSTIPALPQLIDSLTPFQLGSFCRVLAPLVDERDVPMCGGDHCSGNCTLSSAVTNHDWQQIEPAANQLRARRSYVGAADRVVRDRNHAVLLAIPGLLKKLVKLIAVPPSPRNELVLVDHALRSGVFTFNNDFAEAMGDAPHPVTLHATLFATVRAEGQDGEIVIEPVAGAPAPDIQAQTGQTSGQAEEEERQQGQDEGANGFPAEEELRQRVLLMVFRRITGMDNDDTDKTGTDRWDILEKRIDRAAVDHAVGKGFENGVFRERRRRTPHNGLGSALRVAGTAEGGGIIAFEAVAQNPPADDPNNTPTSENGDANINVESNSAQNASPTLRATSDEAATRRRNSDEENSLNPHMSINALLMSSHQVEVLYVLYSLLNGRRKLEVQSALIDAGIFPVLDRFCDALDWSDPSLETKTEESLKVHFIRLLHYMCDGLGTNFPADRLEWLFSEQEREMLQRIEEGKVPNLPGVGPLLPRQMAQLRDAAILGLQNLSINPNSPSNSATPSNSIKSEIESTGSHFQCSPIRSDTHMLEEGNTAASDPLHHGKRSSKEYSSPLWRTPPPAVAADELSPCLTPKDPTVSVERPGIICKITNILIETAACKETESTRRYLVSGCIETFLRTASTAEKTLVAQQGLLKHLIEQLSESGKRTVQVSQFRQTSFDLLGQLVKWNRYLFDYMNEIFRLDRKLLASLLRAVSDRLIDSNVFVRSIVISLERFRAEDALQELHMPEDSLHVPYDFENCLLWGFIETFRVRLVYDLLCSVRMEDVNFENICCVNTALILLVTTCSDERSLDEMLAKVADFALESVAAGAQRPQSLFGLNPIDIFSNFRKLVDFWTSYYRYQGLDVASQEISSNIHFDRLVLVADILLEKLPRLDESIRREALRAQSSDAGSSSESLVTNLVKA